MPSRSVRRRHHKRLRSLEEYAGLSPGLRQRKAQRLLIGWRHEARRRARDLGEAAVWGLAADPNIRSILETLDPTGELEVASELRRLCTEAVAEEAGWHLVSGSRPVAERRRRVALPSKSKSRS